MISRMIGEPAAGGRSWWSCVAPVLAAGSAAAGLHLSLAVTQPVDQEQVLFWRGCEEMPVICRVKEVHLHVLEDGDEGQVARRECARLPAGATWLRRIRLVVAREQAFKVGLLYLRSLLPSLARLMSERRRVAVVANQPRG